MGSKMNSELKLIKIHKRRLEKLQEKAARVGVQMDASVDIEIEDIQEQITELERILRRRLNSLQLKLATYGISADPALSIEAEDIEDYFKDQDEPGS